jgi:hypothetical protein
MRTLFDILTEARKLSSIFLQFFESRFVEILDRVTDCVIDGAASGGNLALLFVFLQSHFSCFAA